MKDLTNANIMDATYGSIKAKDPVNAPKLSPAGVAIQNIKALLPTDYDKEKFSPFGHKVGSQGAMIDFNIINGATTLNGLAAGLHGSTSRKSDPLAYGKSCVRVKNHINWMATKAITHGGLRSRLKNVSKAPATLAGKLAKELLIFNETVQAAFKAEYTAAGIPK